MSSRLPDPARLRDLLGLVTRYFRYNLKVIFGNKFIYFAITAFIFFLVVAGIIFFDSDSNPDAGAVYYLLLLPGVLIIFYPSVFGVQNDKDSGMLEMLFAIPNYRYRVWLVRLAVIYSVAFSFLLFLSILSAGILAHIPVISMAFQIMFPIFFIGSFAFLLSTVIKNGNGTAVAMVVFGMAFWIGGGMLEHSKWFIFLNPFSPPYEMSEFIWSEIVLKNRIYLLTGTLISVLGGLYNLQKRERFI